MYPSFSCVSSCLLWVWVSGLACQSELDQYVHLPQYLLLPYDTYHIYVSYHALWGALKAQIDDKIFPKQALEMHLRASSGLFGATQPLVVKGERVVTIGCSLVYYLLSREDFAGWRSPVVEQ